MKIVETGVITVYDRGSMEIPLTVRAKRVLVHFKHEHPHPNPCDIDHHDEDRIEAFLLKKGGYFKKTKDFLVLSWHIHGNEAREIVWEALDDRF